MTFEEVKPGQLIECDKVYHTEWLFVLSKKKSRHANLITALVDTNLDVIEKAIISDLVWDEDYQRAEVLVNNEEAREKRKDYIVFLWGSDL
jgi:hypothetical protein